MHQTDRDRTFADGGGDAAHGVVAHVAGREDAGHAGLQRQRIALLLPALRIFAAAQQLLTC